jgi:ketosteroid isomerase-like protein
MLTVQDLAAVTARFYAAANELQRGDPEPMFALWSHQNDAMNLGPLGGRQRGWEEIRAYFAHAALLAAANPGAVRASVKDSVIAVAGDLAYVSGTEEVCVTSDNQDRRFTARATNIYRREAGGWKLVYRHADAPPAPTGAAE